MFSWRVILTHKEYPTSGFFVANLVLVIFILCTCITCCVAPWVATFSLLPLVFLGRHVTRESCSVVPLHRDANSLVCNLRQTDPADELMPLSCKGRHWNRRTRGTIDDALGYVRSISFFVRTNSMIRSAKEPTGRWTELRYHSCCDVCRMV